MAENVKEFDWLASLVKNPDLGIDDFKKIGINPDNAELKSKSDYENLPQVKEAFKDDNGNFDKDAFNKFYDNAFSSEEKEQIILTTVTADKNPQYKNIRQGKNTQDYVFLLSIKEAEKYFYSNNERIATSTNYAKIGANLYNWSGVATSAFGATCWRLRTMGYDNYHSCSVRFNGSISYEGDILYSPHYAIRPCIWIQK